MGQVRAVLGGRVEIEVINHTGGQVFEIKRHFFISCSFQEKQSGKPLQYHASASSPGAGARRRG